jgi:hypothetical protein
VPDVGAENFGLRRDKQVQPLQHQHQRGFDFKILTAFIRLGRARPAGAGCPPYYYLTFYYLTLLLFDFIGKKILTSPVEKNHFSIIG